MVYMAPKNHTQPKGQYIIFYDKFQNSFIQVVINRMYQIIFFKKCFKNKPDPTYIIKINKKDADIENIGPNSISASSFSWDD